MKRQATIVPRPMRWYEGLTLRQIAAGSGVFLVIVAVLTFIASQ
jgi:hypothetical protein